MNFFLSKVVKNIDKKGRVSVPAHFRQILSNQTDNSNNTPLVVYPSIKHKAIEACSIERLMQLHELISELDPYSEERDAFETLILGEAVQLSCDSEGRIMMPKHLLEFGEINEQICFLGKGKVFEIWNPQLLDTHLKNAKTIAKDNRNLLKNIRI